MQLKNDLQGRNLLRECIENYYEKNGNRKTVNFKNENQNDDFEFFYCYFLIDRKYVIRYGVLNDRDLWIGGIGLAIGPHYFHPADFWDYQNSERFKLGACTEAVEHNLRLLDEFLGYPEIKKY